MKLLASAVVAFLALSLGVNATTKRLKVLLFSNSMSYSHAAFNTRLGEILKDAGHEVVSGGGHQVNSFTCAKVEFFMHIVFP